MLRIAPLSLSLRVSAWWVLGSVMFKGQVKGRVNKLYPYGKLFLTSPVSLTITPRGCVCTTQRRQRWRKTREAFLMGINYFQVNK